MVKTKTKDKTKPKYDPYKVLGVARTATKEQIDKVFRKLCMKCHPDKYPDDPSAAVRFKELQEAFEILIDQAKRDYYDATGEVPSKVPDNSQAQVYKIISQVMHGVIAKYMDLGYDPEKSNIHKYMVTNLENMAKEIQGHLESLPKQRAKLLKVAERFKCKIEGEENVLAAIARAPLDDIDNAIKFHEEELQRVYKAMELVKNHEYIFDKEVMEFRIMPKTISFSFSG